MVRIFFAFPEERQKESSFFEGGKLRKRVLLLILWPVFPLKRKWLFTDSSGSREKINIRIILFISLRLIDPV
jgi:hypothetical protein